MISFFLHSVSANLMVAKKRANARKTPEIVRFRGVRSHNIFFGFTIWLRYRDSNPDRQSQRLQCYLYTISQYRARISSLYIILHLENLSRGINVKFQ